MPSPLCTALAALLLPISLAAQDQAKVLGATSAAPPSISAAATVSDWDHSILREGSNGWTCFPDSPDTEGYDPMCLDAPSMQWMEAYLAQEPVQISRFGFGYMSSGDAAGSNIDPFATSPTPNNEWMSEGVPHVMMIVPSPAVLVGLPTHPQEGGPPWVMWRDTRYAHVMVPLAEPGEVLMAH